MNDTNSTKAPKTTKLGEQSEWILLYAGREHRPVIGGRGGWNTTVLRKLAARGLLELVKEFTWDSEWRLTELGRQVACAVAFERGQTKGGW